MKNKKVLAFHHGRIGDVFMGISSFDILREIYPDHSLLININKAYQDIAPLFYNQKNIDGIFISDEYENFPNENDRQNLLNCGFDKIFNPMEPHRDGWDWFSRRHQVEDIAFSYGLLPCNKKLNLNRWFNVERRNKTVAYHGFPGFYNKNNDKAPTLQKSQEIVDLLINNGYKVIQVGGHEEPSLNGTLRYNINYFESIKMILGCDFFVGYDSGLTWTLSCYDFPVLAMYSSEYYGEYIKNIQPINENAIYLDAHNVNDISLQEIEKSVKSILCRNLKV